MTILKILILAVIGALIGWTTNVIAIKLLFRPLLPVKVLGFTIQGLIPKRQKDIAKSIGEIVEEELLSTEEIIDQILSGTDKQDVVETIKQRIVSMTEGNLPSFIPSMFSGMIVTYIEDLIDSKGEDLLDEITESLIHKATSTVKISKMVEDKILLLEFDEIEKMIFKIAKSELKHIEYLGGLLGFFLGITQGLILILMNSF